MNEPTEPSAAPTKTRPAWPLFVLAGLSYTPILGFFVGAVGASWGLMSSRRGALRAAAISAGGALLNLVGMMVFASSFTDGNPAAEQALGRAAREELVGLVAAIDRHRETAGEYPASLQLLQRKLMPFQVINIYDQSAGAFTWPRPYRYQIAADGQSFDLFGVGPDKKPGTADDVRPELPDSLRSRTGYRPAP